MSGVIGRKFDIGHVALDDGREAIIVKAGHRGFERIVPPAGDAYAFEQELWARLVEIYVSRTGRSVRVWVDGDEVKS